MHSQDTMRGFDSITGKPISSDKVIDTAEDDKIDMIGIRMDSLQTVDGCVGGEPLSPDGMKKGPYRNLPEEEDGAGSK